MKETPMADNRENAQAAPITIKKYANRRLYNTATSSYVTLDHLSQMVKDGFDFVVFDAKTGEDITRSVLTQIIVEEENKGQNLLPISFLRQLIGFYGNNMQWMVPGYLEYSMQAFSRNQEQMRDYFQSTLGGIFPFGGLEEVSKQNFALLDRAMRMFAPFGPAESPRTSDSAPARPPATALVHEGGNNGAGHGNGANGGANGGGNGGANGDGGKSIEDLQRRLDDLQEQLRLLTRSQGGTGTAERVVGDQTGV